MPFEFVCARCENIHDVPHIENPPDVERECEGCGTPGCIDCTPDGWCRDCDDADEQDDWWFDGEDDEDDDDPWNDPSIP